jgi:hypothetical protein
VVFIFDFLSGVLVSRESFLKLDASAKAKLLADCAARAADHYYLNSGGFHVDEERIRVEQLIQVKLWDAIVSSNSLENANTFGAIEIGSEHILPWYGIDGTSFWSSLAAPPANHTVATAKSRFDLVAFDSQDKARAIIEVKVQFKTDEIISQDLFRISQFALALNQITLKKCDPGIQFVAAISVARGTEDRVRQHEEYIERNSSAWFTENQLIPRFERSNHKYKDRRTDQVHSIWSFICYVDLRESR